MTDFPRGIRGEGGPEALRYLLAFLDGGPSDDMICAAALTIGEPLIDLHWQEVAEEFIGLLAQRSDLRKLVSCCDFDRSVPQALRDRIESFVGPEDNYGGLGVSDS